ncbi:MAG: hypothetical protein NTV01_22875 [Bacteroidia bacterium]|nr:hypothetical protein [Bacteroidia bacterium]
MKALKIIALILAVLILGALTLLYLGAMKAPKKYLEEFKRETADLGNNQIVKTYPEDLLEKRTNLEARVLMSNDDSIGLRISLKDKMVYLEIKGIVLSQTPILDYNVSHFLKNLGPAEKYLMFHAPLTIQKDESTIFKDRFKEIIAPPVVPADATEEIPAPKDTAKSRKNKKETVQLPDPVIYRLYLNHGIKVQFTGQMPDSIPQYWPKFWFEFDERFQFIKDVSKSILKKTPVTYRPTLKLVINYRDAETIYRAMPKKGKVILDL